MPPSQAAMLLAVVRSAAAIPPGNCADVNCAAAGAAALNPKLTVG